MGERRKGLGFAKGAHGEILELSKVLRQRIGFQLEKVQRGDEPDDFKAMSSIGSGVFEIRVDDENSNNVGRCLYVAKFENVVWVLVSFVKRTRATPDRFMELGKRRYRWVEQYIAQQTNDKRDE